MYFFRFSEFVTKAGCNHKKLLQSNRVVHWYDNCKNIWTTDRRENEIASFYAVKCEKSKARTEDRFFLDLNDEKTIYHTQITVACTNIHKNVLPELFQSDVKKNLSQIKEKSSNYLR